MGVPVGVPVEVVFSRTPHGDLFPPPRGVRELPPQNPPDEIEVYGGPPDENEAYFTLVKKRPQAIWRVLVLTVLGVP